MLQRLGRELTEANDVGAALGSAFRPIAETLFSLLTGPTQDEDLSAPAAEDAQNFASERAIPSDWEYRNPVELITAVLYSRLFVIADYVRGIAILAESGNGREPVMYSAAPLARALLDALAFGYWLAEPRIGHAERIRRLILDTLHDHGSRHRIIALARADGVEPALDTEGVATMCDVYGIEYKWGKPDKNTRLRFPNVLGPNRPSAFDIITPLIPSKEYQNLGAVLYHTVTDIAHASTQGVLGLAVLSEGEHGGLDIGFSRTRVLKQVVPVLWALPTPIETICEYLGWEPAPFRQVFVECAQSLSRED